MKDIVVPYIAINKVLYDDNKKYGHNDVRYTFCIVPTKPLL